MAVVLDPKFYGKRDIIIKKLLNKGIETRNGFFSTNRLENIQKISFKRSKKFRSFIKKFNLSSFI